jgi:hypothetical protein
MPPFAHNIDGNCAIPHAHFQVAADCNAVISADVSSIKVDKLSAPIVHPDLARVLLETTFKCPGMALIGRLLLAEINHIPSWDSHASIPAKRKP